MAAPHESAFEMVVPKTRLALVLAVGGLVACSNSDGPTEPPPTKPSVHLTVESAPEAILLNGETYDFLVSAEDTLGNAIPLDELELAWRSLDEKVARVDSNGHVTTVGGGLVQIRATAGGDTAEVRLAVNDIVPEIYDSPPYPVFIAMRGGRVLGYSAWNTGGKRVYEFDSGSWIELHDFQVDAYAGFARRFVALPTGEFVAAANVMTDSDSIATVWSSRSGSWEVDFTEPPDHQIASGPFLFESGSNAVAFLANPSTPSVWLRNSAGAWQNLEHPAKHGDLFLRMLDGFVVDEEEIYVCGGLEVSPGEPPWSPVVTYWDGSTWTIIDLSGYAPADYGLDCSSHVHSGTAYAAMIGSDRVLGVLTLRDGAVTVDTELPEVVNQGVFSDARTLPSGRWLFTQLTRLASGGLLAPTFVWQEEDGSWRQYWLSPDRQIVSFPFVDPDSGQIWFVANTSNTGDDLATVVLAP